VLSPICAIKGRLGDPTVRYGISSIQVIRPSQPAYRNHRIFRTQRTQCLTMRLLERRPNGELVFSEFTGKYVPVPVYAILSHIWVMDNSEEVGFQDIKASSAQTCQ
jgi:hypothetical protein